MREQAKLIRELNSMKLPASPNIQLDVFTLHCQKLLEKWKHVRGNKVSEPASFYHLLLESLPDSVPDESKLGRLKNRLTDDMADQSVLLANPHEYVVKFIERAALIGLPTGGANGHSINATVDGQRKKKKSNCMCYTYTYIYQKNQVRYCTGST